VLDFPRSIPRYIERGRRELDVARRVGAESVSGLGQFSGQFSGHHSPSLGALSAFTPARQVERLQAHTRSTLRALGVVPSGNGHGHETTTPATEASAAGPAPAPASTATPPSPPPPRPVPVDSGIDPETLAIPDYDSLSASQVVPRLDSLGPDELEQVRRYENGKRVRKTILSKIAQLQAPT